MTQPTPNLAELLRFYAAIGVDECVADTPRDWTKISEKSALVSIRPAAAPSIAPPPSAGAFESLGDARKLASQAQTLDELKAALESFEGLTLRRTATNTVFADGNPQSRLMLVGEAPGADEDRMGLPFVGVSGKLLDKMLAAIGHDRTNTYITNVIHWRPPGNRNPSDAEIALSLPFVQRHIELVRPEIVVFVGGVAAKALMQTAQGITKLRGRWSEHQTEGLKKAIPSVAIFHPAYLLRSPAQKGLAWRDMQSIAIKLIETGDAKKTSH